MSKNIYQRVNAVMNSCEYMKKTQAQQGKGVKYDEVIGMIRKLIIDNGIVPVMRQMEIESISGVEGTKQKIYQGKYELDLVNMDDPSDKITHSCYAQGMDGGDKGPGKAHTYAAKLMLVKGFLIETGEDDESRSERIDRAKTIDQDQYNCLKKYCITEGENGPEWSKIGIKLLNAYNINDLSMLPASKYDEAKKRCENANNN